MLRPIMPLPPGPLDPWRPFDEPDITKRIDPFRPPRPPVPRPGGSVSPITLDGLAASGMHTDPGLIESRVEF